MFLFVISLYFLTIKSELIEVCEETYPFIHHNFGIPECEILIRRDAEEAENVEWGDPYAWCENQGTWEGEKFKCYFPSPDGYCKYGESDHSQTCQPKVLGTEEMWLEQNTNSGTDWEWNPLNLDIRGNGGDVSINGTICEEVYESSDEYQMHWVITLSPYDESCCMTNVTLYLNGTKVCEAEEEIDYYWLWIIRSMIEVDERPQNNEKLFMASAWDCALTEEQIQMLYEQGPDRPANFSVQCCSMKEVDMSDKVSKKWSVWVYCVGIPLLIIATIFSIIVVVGWVIGYLTRSKSEEYKPLGEEEDQPMTPATMGRMSGTKRRSIWGLSITFIVTVFIITVIAFSVALIVGHIIFLSIIS